MREKGSDPLFVMGGFPKARQDQAADFAVLRDDFLRRVFRLRRVGETPVKPFGFARKNRAGFFGFIANRNHVIELLILEFVRVFRAVFRDIDSDFLHHLDGNRIEP
jgi:hypothetical protein